MKKLIAVMICMLATSFVMAENDRDRDFDGEKDRRPDFSVLNIADDQKEQFEALLQKHHEEHKELRQANKQKNEEARSQMQALHERHLAEMKAILTEEQFKQFEEIMIQRREHHKKMRKERRSGQDE